MAKCLQGAGGLLGVAGRLSGTVSPFRAEQGTGCWQSPGHSLLLAASESRSLQGLPGPPAPSLSCRSVNTGALCPVGIEAPGDACQLSAAAL